MWKRAWPGVLFEVDVLFVESDMEDGKVGGETVPVSHFPRFRGKSDQHFHFHQGPFAVCRLTNAHLYQTPRPPTSNLTPTTTTTG